MAIIKCPKCGKQISDKGSICPGCMTPVSQLISPKTVPQSLRTATGMYKYCRENQLGSGITKGWDMKHFQVLANSLQPNERVLTVFLALHDQNAASDNSGSGNFAHAITNKRFMVAQKKLIGNIFQSVSLDNVNDITYNESFLKGLITVDTIREKFTLWIANKECAKNIYNAIHNSLQEAKRAVSSSSNVMPSDMTAQLMELKKLLDAGLITTHDYEAKKKQILGL